MDACRDEIEKHNVDGVSLSEEMLVNTFLSADYWVRYPHSVEVPE